MAINLAEKGQQLQFQLWLTFALVATETYGGPHEDRLIHDIFKVRNYSLYSRPVETESDALNIKFGISLQQIIDVDEKNEMLHTNLWLNYEWRDYKLSWNATEYGGIQSIRLPSKLIWTPDILLYNSADEDIDSKFPTNVVVNSDGTCSWIPLGLYISSCAIDITWFPFDDQKCLLKFGSWSYDGNSINLTRRIETIDLTTYQPSGEWQLIAVPAVRNVVKYDCCPEQYIDITFTIHIRRLTLYYGFNLIIPCALTSLLALFTFLQPPDAGEKIGLGITILLSLSVFQLIVAGMVPATSLSVPIVGVYFAAVMIMCTISVIMTVIVLNFHHRKPDMYHMPQWVRRLICGWLAWLLRMSRPSTAAGSINWTTRRVSDDVTVRVKHQPRPDLRHLATRTGPPSLSLIANVKDPSGECSVYHTCLATHVERHASPVHLASRGASPPARPAHRPPFSAPSTPILDRGSHAPPRTSNSRNLYPTERRVGVVVGGGCFANGQPSKLACCCAAQRHPTPSPMLTALDSLKPEVAAILAELRFVTKKMRETTISDEQVNDWKFAAMVIDRLSFWVLTAYLVVATFVIFLSAPAHRAS